MHEHTAVAMSGGVDSTAAAWLLQQEGRELTGITLRLCPGGLSTQAEEDARSAARTLGLAHQVLDLREEFDREVIGPFITDYETGRTPNPCVLCNRRIKFGALLRCAQELGCQTVATGRYLLLKAARLEKDQSYVLSTLTQSQLACALFPLGELSKDEVRSIARQAGLEAAEKGESQDICFIPDGDYGAFLRRRTGKDYPSGPFLDQNGGLLGWHTGIVDYTVGQRRGLGVSSNRGRLYVKEVRPQENTVVLSDNAALFARTLTAEGLNLIACDRLSGPVRLEAKIRYRMQQQSCTVEQTGEDTIRLTFDQPQRAITPGQTVVLYQGEVVVGGATIMKGEN